MKILKEELPQVEQNYPKFQSRLIALNVLTFLASSLVVWAMFFFFFLKVKANMNHLHIEANHPYAIFIQKSENQFYITLLASTLFGLLTTNLLSIILSNKFINSHKFVAMNCDQINENCKDEEKSSSISKAI